MSLGTEIPLQRVKEKAASDSLRPTERDVAHAFGEDRIERKYRKDGGYSWRVKLQQNDGHGTLTKDGHKMQDLLMPWAKKDSERQQAIQGQRPRVTLKDGSGSLQYVDPAQERVTAERNGWHSPGRIVGVLATKVNGDFCEGCGRRKSWCECKEELCRS